MSKKIIAVILTSTVLLSVLLSGEVIAGNRSSLDIQPQPITKDPSLDGFIQCTVHEQLWNVTASTSGATSSHNVGTKFDDIDAGSNNPNCQVAMKDYDKLTGSFTTTARTTSGTSCQAIVTFCAYDGVPACSGGTVCNPGSTPPPPTLGVCGIPTWQPPLYRWYGTSGYQHRSNAALPWPIIFSICP